MNPEAFVGLVGGILYVASLVHLDTKLAAGLVGVSLGDLFIWVVAWADATTGAPARIPFLGALGFGWFLATLGALGLGFVVLQARVAKGGLM